VASKLQSLRQSLEMPNSGLLDAERLKALRGLPPHEHIVALTKGLDRNPATAPWTGDTPEQWARDPERSIRRAVQSLEAGRLFRTRTRPMSNLLLLLRPPVLAFALKQRFALDRNWVACQGEGKC
jgi:hypothetical protein